MSLLRFNYKVLLNLYSLSPGIILKNIAVPFILTKKYQTFVSPCHKEEDNNGANEHTLVFA